MRHYSGVVVTTEFVLPELGNFLAGSRHRSRYRPFIQRLREGNDTRIVPASSELLDRGLGLFSQRGDKSWSMTDCTSFVVTHEDGLTDAVTADHHFEQAGFTTLLK